MNRNYLSTSMRIGNTGTLASSSEFNLDQLIDRIHPDRSPIEHYRFQFILWFAVLGCFILAVETVLIASIS